MSETAVAMGHSHDYEMKVTSGLVASLARILALASLGAGALFALLWFMGPSPWNALIVLAAAIFGAASLASIGLVRAGRTVSAAYLLVACGLLLIAACSWSAGTPVISAAYVVPVMLAGLLLRRPVVIASAGVAVTLFLLQVATGHIDSGLVAMTPAESRVSSILAVLAVILLLSLLAYEYSSRLAFAMAQLDARAKDAERHAGELEMAKAEIERRANELAATKREIESRTQVSMGVAAEIQAMAKELATTSNEQASGSTEQAAAMGEIVATMEELSRAAIQIASNSAAVSHQVSSALEAAETGHQAVEETIAGLDRIRTEVRSVAEKNLTLGQKTQAIGEIIEVISEIADRTHLLALNAAIESAAAGEYGRRFSVVASQVKELATEAKSAAHQVRVAVAEIQRAASATVLAAEKSEADVEVGAGLGRGAGEAITQIVETVQEVAGAAREMLMATQQQQSASEQVVSTIRQIEQVTRQSAEGSSQISQTVSQLIAAAGRLE